MNRGSRSKLYGFTLVELLIVVSIIGVLATIGVPTFRQMVQKAKKSEAKVALGGLYTSETAFFSEYGAYGNNLDKIGFDLEGSTTGRVYSVGFQNTSCAQATTAEPATSAAQGSALNLAFPGYFTGSVRAVAGATSPTSGCLAGSVTANTGSDFTASANGLIAPGSGATVDQWQIDRFRALTNVQDGVRK